jgi:hypothetical protein
MKYILKSNKIFVFKVTYRAKKFYTLVDKFDRDELSIMFAYYEQSHVKEFTGPDDWLTDVHEYFSKMFKMFEVFQFNGLCLYDPKHINELWALLKSELDEINKVCENL